MNTDERLTYFEEALKQERRQRQSDNEERLKELRNWQGISETLSSQVTIQRSYLSDFDKRLGTESVSEDKRHEASVRALDTIETEAEALQRSLTFWKVTGIVAISVGVGMTIYAAVK